uniref:FH2 domain containing 3 n=1 Tax=Scophthalmus maximus TaxID=52904 RepID=A0A8D3B8E7_SCOMX
KLCPFMICCHVRSMKKLNWDPIPNQRVLGKVNVWTSTLPQRDLVLDIRSMEELFSHVDKRASLRNSRVIGLKKGCDGVDLFPPEPQVNGLFSPESYLKVKQLLSFSGSLSVLPEADRFMVQLVKVPGYEEQLKMMVLREEFFPLMEEVKGSVAVMTKAAKELLDCDDLHSVIRLVLKAGNYMNAGGYSANAIGFRMTSLLKLADTKANKPGMNLMHYVAKQAEDIDAKLLTFHSQLEHIGMASRICKGDVVTDFEREVKKVKEVKLYSGRQPGVLQKIETFLMRADAKLVAVESSLRELNSLSHAVAEFFCEDPATFKLEECCSIFLSFCKRFDTAVRENQEREASEQRRKRKESMHFSAKRRSTVSGPGPERGRDSSCLESALHSFLSTAPGGLARCRRTVLPPIEGSPSGCSSPTDKSEATPAARQERPEKKQAKLQKEQEQVGALEDKEEAEKMRAMTRKVLQYQNSRSSLDGDGVSGTPRRSESPRDTPTTPSTPRPRTRDFFFSDAGGVLPTQAGRTSPRGGSASVPECPPQRAVSQGPILRSASVDEARQSPVSRFRLGDLFQRSYSSGARTENVGDEVSPLHRCKATNPVAEGQVNSSGFISFFRRIGGRSRPGDVEEPNLTGSKNCI